MRMVEPEPWSISIGLRDEPHGVQRFLVAAGARADGAAIRDLPLGERALDQPRDPQRRAAAGARQDRAARGRRGARAGAARGREGAPARLPAAGPARRAGRPADGLRGAALLALRPRGSAAAAAARPAGRQRPPVRRRPAAARDGRAQRRGLRDSAVVRFRLDRPATRDAGGRRDGHDPRRPPGGDGRLVDAGAAAAGAARLVWRPARRRRRAPTSCASASPGTGGTRVYGGDARLARRRSGRARPGRRRRSTARSYVPGQPPSVRSRPTRRRSAPGLPLREPAPPDRARPGDERRRGDAAGRGRLARPPRRAAHGCGSSAPAPGRAASTSSASPPADGRASATRRSSSGRRGSARRVAVVLSTNTWQAYNFDDADGDGWGDSWYVSGAIRSVDLRAAVPRLRRPVPLQATGTSTFIAWLNRTGKRADFLSDDDLEAVRSGDALRRAYDLVVFPGHEEYVTTHAYDVVRRYRDLGGNLHVPAANNFFWRVRRDGPRLVREQQWRELGRPEARLVGVQYVGSDQGAAAGAVPSWRARRRRRGCSRAPASPTATGFGRVRDRDRRARAASPARDAGARADPRPDGPGPLRRDDVLRDGRAARGCSPPGRHRLRRLADDPRVERLVENAWTSWRVAHRVVAVEALGRSCGRAAPPAPCGRGAAAAPSAARAAPRRAPRTRARGRRCRQVDQRAGPIGQPAPKRIARVEVLRATRAPRRARGRSR